jgi:hypothetical protein
VSDHNVTTGGVLIGLLSVAVVLVPWYRRHGGKSGDPLTKGTAGGGGKRQKLAELGPFLWAFTLGTLSSLAAGGLMGQTALRIDQSSNVLGDRMLYTLAGASSPSVTRPGIAMLQPGGSVLLVTVLIGCAIWFWASKRAIKWRMVAGLLAGCTLGPTAGVAGVAGVIAAPVFNTVGAWLVGIGTGLL